MLRIGAPSPDIQTGNDRLRQVTNRAPLGSVGGSSEFLEGGAPSPPGWGWHGEIPISFAL
jgi:hypothetical protein